MLSGSLDDIRAFCAVIESGSISAAARHLGETKGGTSRRISRLERQLGTALLARTSRAVTATEEGLTFYSQASQALALLADAAEAARHSQSEPRGHLRVTAALDIGIYVLPELIAQFREEHPHITVELLLTDTQLDLASNRIDLALRASGVDLPDTTYRASSVARFEIGLYASPRYLTLHSAPKQPKQLSEHCLVVYRAPPGALQLPLKDRQGRVEHFVAKPVIRTTNYASVHSLVLAGAGIGGIPDLVASRAVEKGELIRVLPEWTVETVTLHALTLGGRDAPARVDVFREFVRGTLSGNHRRAAMT